MTKNAKTQNWQKVVESHDCLYQEWTPDISEVFTFEFIDVDLF